MEPEGMTRAWPIVPLISRNASATQNHAMISFWMRLFMGGLAASSFCFPLLFLSAFMFHRHRPFCLDRIVCVALHCAAVLGAAASFAHLELHQVGRIDARVTRRAEPALGVIHGLLESSHRQVA